LNYGIFYYDTLDFEKAIVQYQRAENIFTNLGNKYGQGISLLNLGESYLRICEYQDSIDSLNEAIAIFQRLNSKEEEAEAIFLIGQFYYQLGDKRQLNALVEKFKKFIEKNNSVQKHRNNLNLLIQFNLYLNEKYKEITKGIDDIIKSYSERNDRENNYNFAKGIFVYSTALIKLEKFENALEKLSNENFLKLCSNNLILQAERYYLLGIISEKIKKKNLELPLYYFNKVYKIIENQSITELSWTINFTLAEFYFERGNINKAKNYVRMAESLLNHITNKITNDQLKSIYLKENQRRHAIEVLNQYKKQL
jgi:tetratricopeptide (TPR) repeat protein